MPCKVTAVCESNVIQALHFGSKKPFPIATQPMRNVTGGPTRANRQKIQRTVWPKGVFICCISDPRLTQHKTKNTQNEKGRLGRRPLLRRWKDERCRDGAQQCCDPTGGKLVAGDGFGGGFVGRSRG